MRLELECRPDKLFKYTCSKYVPDVLKGRFRIGTLYDYRSAELNAEIGDRGEGMRQYLLTDGKEGLTYEGLARFPVFQELVGASAEISDRLKASMEMGIPVAIEQHAPDCFIYCMTTGFDDAVMKSFGCDACFEIDDPIGFFRELSKPMEQHAIFGVMSECVYVDKFGPIAAHSHKRAQVIKDPSYSHQKEVRILWDTRKSDHQLAANLSTLKPIFVRSSNAAGYLRQIV